VYAFSWWIQIPLVFYKQKRNPPKKVVIAKLLLILLGPRCFLSTLDEEVSLLSLYLLWVGGGPSSLSSLYFSFIVD
jgi:hypothetical protein